MTGYHDLGYHKDPAKIVLRDHNRQGEHHEYVMDQGHDTPKRVVVHD